MTAMQLFVKNTCVITIAGTSLFRSSGFFVMVIELSCRELNSPGVQTLYFSYFNFDFLACF